MSLFDTYILTGGIYFPLATLFDRIVRSLSVSSLLYSYCVVTISSKKLRTELNPTLSISLLAPGTKQTNRMGGN